MFRICGLVFIVFIFLSCKNEQQKFITSKVSDTIKSKEHIKNSLFLGLSPYMSENDFNSKINSLNEEQKLNNREFIFSVGKDTYLFNVKRANNSIRLNTTLKEVVLREDVSYDISQKYLDFYENKFLDIIQIFEDKYQQSNIQLPENLPSYELPMEHYKLYRNNEKSVLIGYKLIGFRYPNEEESKIEKEETEKSNPYKTGIFKNLGEAMGGSREVSDPVFGIDLEINYYYNEDMDVLLDSLTKKSLEINKNLNIQNNLEIKKENIIKNNKKEL